MKLSIRLQRILPSILISFAFVAHAPSLAVASPRSILSAVAFEENRGQFPADVHFATGADEFEVVAYDGSLAVRAHSKGARFEFRLRFDGGNSAVVPVAENPLEGHVNYFRGGDPSGWQTGIVRYERVRYADVYPGIDAILHDREGRVELDFEVAPYADASRIAISFEGVDRVDVGPGGVLELVRGDARFELSAPEIYQREGDLRKYLAGRYRLEEANRVEFDLASYDTDRELVIDPVFLGFSTRLGGSGTDRVGDLTTDSAGNIYVTGSTDSSLFGGVAVSPAPVMEDVFVAKIDPTGQNLIYLSFFGGDNIDKAWGIEADAAGNAYVAGYTLSSSFPNLNAYRATPVNTDAFLLKLDPTGAMTYGTLYGGAEADGEFNGGIGIHEPSGRIYIGSRTDTTGLPGVGAFSTNCPNGPCSFVAGFDPSLSTTSTLVYATYVSEPTVLVPNNEGGGVLDLDVDSSGNVYAFGFSNPDADLVVAGQGFLDATNDLNNNDHYLVKLDPSLAGSAQRVYSTFIGGQGDETERGRIAALDSGIVYIGSKTDSTAATFSLLNAVQPTNAGGEDGYVAKIDTTQTGALSQLWTTFIGSPQNDDLNAVAVDSSGNVWIMATVSANSSASFPQVFPLPGSPAFGIDDDAVVAQIASDGSAILFAGPTVAGSGPQEQGIAVQPSGRIVMAGTRDNADFPLKGGLPLMAAGNREVALVGLDPTGDLGLVLEVSQTSDPARTGDTFGVQYLIKNRGTSDASNGELSTDFPVGLTASLTSANCSLPGASATCELFEDIPRGGDAPLYILASSATDGTYGFNASVTSDLVDPSPGDDSDTDSVDVDSTGSFPASLVLSDFDVVTFSFDTGGFSIDTPRGILATSNGSLGDVVNMMKSGAPIPFQVEELFGQGEIAFGFVDDAIWTPSAGDGEDLFGRDFNASADRVFGIVDARGTVELRTASPFNEGRVIATGRVPLGRAGLLSLDLSPTNAAILFDGFVVASGDPFTSDSRDADPMNVGDDFVMSVGFGTEDRGTAILSVPEPSMGWMLLAGAPILLALRTRLDRRNSV